MILFLDRLLDVVCTYYCVPRVTCLVSINATDRIDSAVITKTVFVPPMIDNKRSQYNSDVYT